MTTRQSHRLVATVLSTAGPCGAGHKVGDKFEFSASNPNGLCGFFFHDIFHKICVMQFGGHFPWQTDENILIVECSDRAGAVRLELRRYPQ